MTDCWANVMPAGVVHSLHLHPTSFISGTYYVEVPKGAGALKFEDPRLGLHMAAPPRRADAPRSFRSFVSLPAKAGDLVLFESWLRHEVPPARFSGERISISFNYGWAAKDPPLMGPHMRALLAFVSLLAAAGTASADQELPIFDAHMHYSHDAWEVVPPQAGGRILRRPASSAPWCRARTTRAPRCCRTRRPS